MGEKPGQNFSFSTRLGVETIGLLRTALRNSMIIYGVGRDDAHRAANAVAERLTDAVKGCQIEPERNEISFELDDARDLLTFSAKDESALTMLHSVVTGSAAWWRILAQSPNGNTDHSIRMMLKKNC